MLKAKESVENRTCPLLRIGQVSDSITISCNEEATGVLPYAECSIPSLPKKNINKKLLRIDQNEHSSAVKTSTDTHTLVVLKKFLRRDQIYYETFHRITIEKRMK